MSKNFFPFTLKRGDKVTWNDPDAGTCSRTGRIRKLKWVSYSGPDSVGNLTFDDGHFVQVLAKELS